MNTQTTNEPARPERRWDIDWQRCLSGDSDRLSAQRSWSSEDSSTEEGAEEVIR